MTDHRIIEFNESSEYILQQCNQQPTIGIILGSGLGKLADKIETPTIIPYKDIPHFKT